MFWKSHCFLFCTYLSHLVENPTMCFPTRSDTNRSVQSQKRARILKFRTQVEEELYYPSNENKGADQLRSYCEADLRLCFRICRLLVFPWGGSFVSTPAKHLISIKLTSHSSGGVINLIVDYSTVCRSRLGTCRVNRHHVACANQCDGRDGVGVPTDDAEMAVVHGTVGLKEEWVIKLSRIVRKPVFGVSDQVRHKPGCTVSEAG